MSLRLKVNLIMAAAIASLVAAMIALQIQSMQRSVREEVEAANAVASQLLNRIGWVYATEGLPNMVRFLDQLGRVRANEITLTDNAGEVLYQSPPSAYKAGREAPEWFERLLLPTAHRKVIKLPQGELTIEPNPSRAILDGWDDVVLLASSGAVGLLAINLLVFWAMGRAVRPFRQIVGGLERLQAGDFDVALPALPGREANAIGAAFNRMTAVLKDNLDARQRAFEAERQLSDSRELAQLVEHHIEAERREIARALHDELGQSVTAIRSLATSVAQRCQHADAQTAQAARVINEEAGRLYDQMHGMIPRLAPMSLETLGLADALRDLIDRVAASQPTVEISLDIAGLSPGVPELLALPAYRIVQEGLTNALRHGQATAVTARANLAGCGLEVEVIDNGAGVSGDWRNSGHFGLRWLNERVELLGGRLTLTATNGGTVLRAVLPVEGGQP